MPRHQTEIVFPDSSSYIGRFAPSPSGPLHTGSLIAALASYLDAKANHGLWYVRMEDLDPPRESPQAASLILKTLEQLELFWDGEVLYQSHRHEAYREALDSLKSLDLTFQCTCSRQQIQSSEGMHWGVCQPEPDKAFSIRCCASNLKPGSTSTMTFQDIFQGEQIQKMDKEIGDFVIKRKDGFYAYQLAVVVDDAWQKITHVIRGIDLMNCTGRQLYLQNLLNTPSLQYGHIPVIVNTQGQKLSKQHFAEAVNTSHPQELLLSALSYLKQDLDSALIGASIKDILSWAISHWKPDRLFGIQSLQEFEDKPE